MTFKREFIERGAASILNARGMRRGMMPVKNPLDLVPPRTREEAIEEASACFAADVETLVEALRAARDAMQNASPYPGPGRSEAFEKALDFVRAAIGLVESDSGQGAPSSYKFTAGGK